MESSGILTGLLLIGLFTVLCQGQVSPEISVEDAENDNVDQKKEFVEALEEILGDIYDRRPAIEKRGIPRCAVGTRCAMRLGPRFGQLCECARGSYCNSYLLKCI
ncbi:cocaine- and amphetamine-regulated transcript-like [Brachyhypopomus gauderio]|uniref:cocaine- and amphetamine-regulated transcript-like n=1 Tax=Brachyhypopomus gauderio TaxID=698409 RepID=UPI004040F1E2